MTKIRTVHARPDGAHIVNKGAADEIAVRISPDSDDAMSAEVLRWLRSNKAASWEPSLEEVKLHAKASMVRWINALTAKLRAGYPSDEVASWPTKATEARSFLAGKKAGPLLRAEAEASGKEIGDVAASVVARADVYETILGSVAGFRRATDAAIDAAGDADSVSRVLAEALRNAIARAVELGIEHPQA